jgi:sulfite exporter TauE/SafE
MATPILLFLAAKLTAYTILGALLGLLGSMFQLSPLARAVLQFLIAIFMIGTALRMLNVHPFFRHFVIEPPAALRRRLRKTAASETSAAAPLFLGALTVLIPCGVTQAMMAVALATSSPLQGAALMFAFTLGASPVFFAVAYFATTLGKRMEKNFTRFAAVVILLLGLFALDTGLNLAGSPVSITRAVNGMFAARQQNTSAELIPFEPAGPEPALEALSVDEGDDVIVLKVKNTGYVPQVLEAKANQPLRLKLVSKDVHSCSMAFVIPSLNAFVNMKPTDVQYIDIPAQEPGTRMGFMCSMGMFTGDIIFN